MGAELGRISGALLSPNLLRNGTDLAFETNLLYLDVNNGRVGIKTSTPNRPLTVNGTFNTTNIDIDVAAEIANLTFDNNNVTNFTNSITLSPDQSTDPTIKARQFNTQKFRIKNNSIENATVDDNIVISANGSGQVRFYTSIVDVSGDVHATGDITWEGNIEFGSDDQDSVTFSSDVNSDIIPDVDNLYDLGTVSKKWRTLYSVETFSDTLTTPSLTVNDINMLLTQGKTIYVSVNGSDTNTGTHLHSTYKTVKHALSVAQSGDEIVIFPGTYQEEFPLTIPEGVEIRGTGIRATIIEPTVSTNTKDCFLLNGQTTVSFLTIQNFFYDSLANTGYAFRFAPGMATTTRSPYVYNVTVITKGSVTTLTDPLGFNQGDAGGGIYLDGSVCAPGAPLPPTGLFHAVTIIAPNNIGIVGKNGVRIEWLNCFTYFSSKGIFLENGATGRAGQGIIFGAEMRSINSANIYGTYGAVADGASTLAYLIGHNFAYIGTGANSFNDRSVVVQANEVVATNNGKIYYDSVDHKGDYRIGNIFYVNQETGNVIFDAQAIDFSATGSIVFESPNSITFIDAFEVSTGNIRVYDNNIDSTVGPVNLFASSGSTYLNTNVFVTGNITVSGDTYVDGNVFIGNQSTDTVNIAPYLTETIEPKVNNTYTIGQSGKIWRTGFFKLINIDAVTRINNNSITTLTSNTDLRLIAAGTGKLKILSSDVQLDQSLTVNGVLTVDGDTDLQATEITGTTTLVGDLTQLSGDIDITGNFNNNNIEITGATSYIAVPDIKIQNNDISVTASNSDIIFTATGAGSVFIDQRLKITDRTISNTWVGATNDTDKGIVFDPNGTGNVSINSVTALRIPYSNTTNRVLSANGEIRHNSSNGLFEGFTTGGLIALNGLYDTDRNTYILAESTPGANNNVLDFFINGSSKATISSSQGLRTDTFHIDDIRISSNQVQNLNANNELVIGLTDTTTLNGIAITGNQVVNSLNASLTIASTGPGGFVKFMGGQALVIPSGNTSQRLANAEVGTLRYNNEIGYTEVYGGIENGWLPATGPLSVASQAEVLEIMDYMSLIFG